MKSEKQVKQLGRKLCVGPIGKMPKESMFQEIDKSNMYKKIDKRKAEQYKDDMLNPKVDNNETTDKALHEQQINMLEQ